MFPDEFGYWASAANVLGYDWSEVASLGSYYSFGYSFILIIILKLFSDSFVAYRAAVFLNLIFQILSFFLLKSIFKKLFDEIDEVFLTFMAGACVLYPAWCFYIQMTMAEGVLFFVYTLTVYLVLRFLDNSTILNCCLMIFSAAYLYTVHMRTVGVIISIVLILLVKLVMALFRKRNRGNIAPSVKKSKKRYIQLAVAAAFFVLLFIVANYLKAYFIDSLFSSGDESLVAANDYSGQIWKILRLFSVKGIIEFFASMMGKILYFGCATFGFGYIGVSYIIRKVFKKDIKYLFIFLTSFFQFMIMCVYCSTSAAPDSNRFDLFLHGRYFDFAIPILMAIGIYAATKMTSVFKFIIPVGTIMTLTALVAVYVVKINDRGMTNPQGLFMIGMNFFLDRENFHPYFVIIMTSICTYIIGVVLLLLLRRRSLGKTNYLIFVFYIVLVISSFVSVDKLIYAYQRYTFGDTQVADAIFDLRAEGYNGNVIYLDEGFVAYIDNVQFRARDEHISVQNIVYLLEQDENAYVDFVNSLPEDALIITHFNSVLNEYMDNRFDGSWLSGHLNLYYMK